MLSFIAYVVIPAYTLSFVRGTNWLTSNLSVIGSQPGRRSAFFFLGTIIGLYYLTVLTKFLSCLPRHILETVILYTAFLLLLFAVTIPYIPESVPLQSFLHVISALSASLLLALCLWLIFRRLSALSQGACRLLRSYRMSMAVIAAVSVTLLLMAGIISSALEIYFIIATTILVQNMYTHREDILSL